MGKPEIQISLFKLGSLHVQDQSSLASVSKKLYVGPWVQRSTLTGHCTNTKQETAQIDRKPDFLDQNSDSPLTSCVSLGKSPNL